MSRNRRTPASIRYTELKKLQREWMKLQERQQAKYEVELYETYVDMIQSLHKECGEPVDWEALLHQPAPFIQGDKGPSQLAAEQRLAEYKPSWFDRLFRRELRKRSELNQHVADAVQQDLHDYKAWEANKALAEGVTNGDSEAYLKAIKEKNPLGDLTEYGSNFEFFVDPDPKVLSVQLMVHSDKVVPREMKTLTKTGLLSIQPIPKTKYYALEQDFVCSCAIRIAREMFALLPLKQVYVHAQDERINPSLGMLERVNLLSVKFDRSTLQTLHLEAIDCSEAMNNFEHRMKFMKTRGFQPVSSLG